MSKFTSRNDNQLSIFELLRQFSASNGPASTEGRCCVIDGLRRALRDAIKASPLSRHQIAGEMSHLVGHTITKEMIDSWTREPQSADQEQWIPASAGMAENGSDTTERKIKRHVPTEYVPAFCKVTGSMEPLRLLCEAAGFFVFPGPDALRAEIRKIEEEIREAQDRKRKRIVFLREMEKPKSRQDLQD